MLTLPMSANFSDIFLGKERVLAWQTSRCASHATHIGPNYILMPWYAEILWDRLISAFHGMAGVVLLALGNPYPSVVPFRIVAKLWTWGVKGFPSLCKEIKSSGTWNSSARFWSNEPVSADNLLTTWQNSKQTTASQTAHEASTSFASCQPGLDHQDKKYIETL